MSHDHGGQPEVQVRDGTKVTEALYEWVKDLLEHGRSIEVSDGAMCGCPRHATRTRGITSTPRLRTRGALSLN